MTTTDPGTLLERMGAKVSRRKVMVNVIGVKMRDPETGRIVAMIHDAPPFVVYCTDPAFAVPTDAQKKACLDYWIREPRAPDCFIWNEHEQPKLKPTPKPKKKYQPTEEDDL